MKTTDPHLDTALLGKPARDASGGPTLDEDEAVAFVRHHLDIERIRTTDYDVELWQLWQREVERAQPDATNRDVLDRVVEAVRAGA
ncbi:MAG TPA: hypothetical protein VIK95_06165 [Egibacteraceae bacterium]